MGFENIFSMVLPLLLASILMLSVLFVLKPPWFKAFMGERPVNLFSKVPLDGDKYYRVDQVTLATAGGTTWIDHIIVSEYGVFVIETKHMKGLIDGDARQRRWTQEVFHCTQKFQNPLHQNNQRVHALKAMLELTDQQIFSVIVFAGKSTLSADMPENVITAADLLGYIKSKTKQVILSNDVPMIVSKIEAERLMPSRETAKMHPNRVERVVEKKRHGHTCPECGGPIVVRESGKKGAGGRQKFIGCPKFPDCRGTALIAVESGREKPQAVIKTVFTDSWGNRTWRDDELQPVFVDRQFR